MTVIASAAQLPSDGMITVKSQGHTRRQGWHIERIDYYPNDNDWSLLRVSVTPVNIGTGIVEGEARAILLRFGIDEIETMTEQQGPSARYRGVNRAGTCVTGSTGAETAGGLAERLYRARWQELTVTDAAGEEIGGIVPASDLYNDTGHRVWWGES